MRVPISGPNSREHRRVAGDSISPGRVQYPGNPLPRGVIQVVLPSMLTDNDGGPSRSALAERLTALERIGILVLDATRLKRATLTATRAWERQLAETADAVGRVVIGVRSVESCLFAQRLVGVHGNAWVEPSVDRMYARARLAARELRFAA